MWKKGSEWAVDHSGGIPALKDWLESLAIDWPKIIHQFLGSLTEILNSTVELVGLLSEQYRPPVHEPDFWNLSPLGKGETPRSGQADPESVFCRRKDYDTAVSCGDGSSSYLYELYCRPVYGSGDPRKPLYSRYADLSAFLMRPWWELWWARRLCFRSSEPISERL